MILRAGQDAPPTVWGQMERKGNIMRKADLQQQAVELIKQLSTENLKAGIDYLNYLQDKNAWEANQRIGERFRNRQEFRIKTDGQKSNCTTHH